MYLQCVVGSLAVLGYMSVWHSTKMYIILYMTEDPVLLHPPLLHEAIISDEPIIFLVQVEGMIRLEYYQRYLTH